MSLNIEDINNLSNDDIRDSFKKIIEMKNYYSYKLAVIKRPILTCEIGVYELRNLINNKIYIGQSRQLGKRFSQHSNDLKNNKHPNKSLQDDYNKYGYKFFEFNVIKYLTKEDKIQEREKEIINNEKDENLYNKTKKYSTIKTIPTSQYNSISCTLSDDIYSVLIQNCKKENRSISSMVREILTTHLKDKSNNIILEENKKLKDLLKEIEDFLISLNNKMEIK